MRGKAYSWDSLVEKIVEELFDPALLEFVTNRSINAMEGISTCIELIVLSGAIEGRADYRHDF